MVKGYSNILFLVPLSSIVGLFWHCSFPNLEYLPFIDEVLDKDISSHSDGVEFDHEEISTTKRVVLLVGPHKTSSTSEQVNIIRWINNNKLKNWSWPAPKINDNERCGVGRLRDRAKVFYPYIDTLNDRGNTQCLRIFYANHSLSKYSFISDFEQGFRDAWKTGNNLIIGSEAIDFVSAENRLKGDRLMNRILHAMPWNSNQPLSVQLNGSNDDITVVVNYRTPRRKHLISLWHECCMNDISFEKYLTTYVPKKHDKLRALDSLNLVELFLNEGLDVVLIDMAGVSTKGYDISNVVACDVLRADCTFNMSISGDIVLPSVMNVKTNSHNMTNHQLEMIEKKIRNYDCKFQSITAHARLTILYPDELMRIFDDCKHIALSDRILSRHTLKKELREIAKGD